MHTPVPVTINNFLSACGGLTGRQPTFSSKTGIPKAGGEIFRSKENERCSPAQSQQSQRDKWNGQKEKDECKDASLLQKTMIFSRVCRAGHLRSLVRPEFSW